MQTFSNSHSNFLMEKAGEDARKEQFAKCFMPRREGKPQGNF